NDVLDLSKIEAGQLQIRHEPVDVVTVVERVLDSVRTQAQHKQLTLNLECPETLPEISGDRRRIEQILLNLLSNAIKFTDRGGVTLRVEAAPAWLPSAANGAVPSAAPDARPALRFRVLDTGIGIAEDDLAQLFQPFRQVDSGIARQHEGTGLGLVICRRLAGLMGGEITAFSRIGEGSEFTVVLPLLTAPAT
ncbi:MAG: histidine kinase, partial [Xanthomonadales bacterium]|nr:histidine kinase [Xanthomonadales bacterium]